MSGIKNNIVRLLTYLICTCVLWSCGDSDTFTIEGTVDGNATINLRFIYYTNGTLVKGLTAARDGKFEYKGVSTTPTVVEILDNDYRLMGRVYVTNGDRIECHLTRNAPNAINVTGNEISERWAEFLNKNANLLESSDANLIIEKYITEHPDDIVSTLLMITSYDASNDAYRADSIMSIINPEVRPSVMVEGFNALLQRLVTSTATEPVSPISGISMRDSLIEFNPAAKKISIIVLSDAESGRRDSIVPALKRLHRKSLRSKLQIGDVCLDRDTATWHQSVRPDSAGWPQIWVAGALASPGIDRLGISRLPYFIVTDSTGNQVLRTPSIKRVESFVDGLISDNK